MSAPFTVDRFSVGEDVTFTFDVIDRATNGPVQNPATYTLTLVFADDEDGPAILTFTGATYVALTDPARARFTFTLPRASLAAIPAKQRKFFAIWSESASGARVLQARGYWTFRPAIPPA